MSHPRIWPTAQAAEAAKAPGETVREIAGAWLTLPPGTDVHQLYASLQRGGLTRPLPPAVRTTDPDTSRSAASRDRSADRAAVLEAHRQHPDGLTDFELAAILGRKQTSVGKRRGELVALGLIEPTDERRPSDTGTPAIVWRITETGRHAA